MSFKKHKVVETAPEHVDSSNDALPPPPAPTPAPVVVAPSPKFRVKSNCRASFFGQAVSFKKDDILDQSGYGADGIRRLIESGADLEEIK